MRLTLRTLLAYLDDTLDPTEVKVIGQKVSESDTAQELIARIREVVRKRRLTTPPSSGQGAIDPNTISEYLDSELSDEQVTELEKLCLESEVHLAEIAACHQILTLVLGEPALVPPTARQRMYGLVSGREAIPYRKPRPAQGPRALLDSQDDDGDAEDTFLLGLPFRPRSAPWIRWAVPVIALVLLGILGFTLWRAVVGIGVKQPDSLAGGSIGPRAEADVPPEEKPGGGEVEKPEKPPVQPEEQPKEPVKPVDDNPPPPPPPIERPGNVTPGTPAPVAPPPSRKASLERVQLGKYVNEEARPSVLVTRADRENKTWTRLRPQSPVFSVDPLISLPGYRSDVSLDSGVRLTLWGNLLELLSTVPVLESCVQLHAPGFGAGSPDRKFDADLTLLRGRVVIRSTKSAGPAYVRLRFLDEIWDLTLEQPDTQILVDLISRYPPEIGFRSGEAPLVQLVLGVLRGNASLKADYSDFPGLKGPPGPAMFQWDNKRGVIQGPAHLEEAFAVWSVPVATNEVSQQMMLALQELATRLVDRESVNVALTEAALSDRPTHRVLGVFCLGAIDDLDGLLDALSDEKHADVRQAAIFALRHWTARDLANDQKLFEALVARRISPTQAEIIMELLHDFSPVQRAQPETYAALIEYLRHDLLPIRELAYWHLVRLVEAGRRIPYDPAGGTDQRERAYDGWKRLIPDGKLPAPPMGGGGPGAG